MTNRFCNAFELKSAVEMTPKSLSFRPQGEISFSLLASDYDANAIAIAIANARAKYLTVFEMTSAVRADKPLSRCASDGKSLPYCFSRAALNSLPSFHNGQGVFAKLSCAPTSCNACTSSIVPSSFQLDEYSSPPL